jgi:signal transduction histidine kinase
MTATDSKFSRSLLQLTEAMAQPHKRNTIALVRDSFCQILLDIMPSGCTSSTLLWLLDECDGKHIATLWAIKASFTEAFNVPREPARLVVAGPNRITATNLLDQCLILDQFAITIKNCALHKEIRKVLPDLDFDIFKSEFLLPLSEGDFASGAKLTGFLHLISSCDVTFPGFSAVEALTFAKILSKASAARFTAGRRQRLSNAITKFHAPLPTASTSDLLVKRIAETLFHEARAVSCAIYMREGALGLKLWVDENQNFPSPKYLRPGSFFERLFRDRQAPKVRRGLRLPLEGLEFQYIDIRNDLKDELPAELDPDSTSCLTYVVRCPSYREGSETVPLLLIRLLTRPQEQHIGGTFTTNDQKIVVQLGGYLTELLPDVLFREATGHVAAASADIQNKIRERLARVGFLLREREFAKLIKQAVPAIREIHISQRTQESDGHITTYFWNVNGESIQSHPAFNWHLDQSGILSGTIGSKERPPVIDKIIDIPVSSIDKRLMGLRCFLHSDDLTVHEWNIIEYILAELRFAVLGAFDITDKTYQIAEIRHALNAGLTGLLGHMKLANDVYTESLQAFREGDEKIAERRIFQEAQYRKTIERARISVEQVSAFFEDTRVLLADITKDTLQRTSVYLPTLINELRVLFLRETIRRKLQIVLGDLPERTTIVYDKTLLKLAIFNLVDNAVKYSFAENNISIILEAKNAQLRLSIQNIGPYIPPELRDEIFEPFRRIRHAGGIQAMPGTGLGLAASRKIARVHGGDVRVSSVPTELRDDEVARANTVFTLFMP